MKPPDWVIALLGPAAHDAQPLTGGVSSDVWRVRQSGGSTVVAKRAVERLRVQAPWSVPLTRNTFEVKYLSHVGARVPGFVPAVIAADESLNAFAMADLGARPSWRDDLAGGRIDLAVPATLGQQLAAAHAATANDAYVAREFATDALFEALRIEPYLRYTASVHPEHAEALTALADELAGTHVALVHGDVSPKNIIVTDDGPVLTDAECAWYGDPAFDLAFCLNHLLLKRIWRPHHAEALRDAARILQDAYLSGVTWEGPEILAQRAARLLPALTLARVDGRSPVDYLNATQRDSLRHVAGGELYRAEPDPLSVSLHMEELLSG